jgi:hypothetical protein
MCLPVTPYKIEKEWKHQGLSCAVTIARNQGGSRCGYVRVPPGHPAYGKDYDSVDVEAHGGLTFAAIEPCTEHEDGQGWWFGFDCRHAWDLDWDPNLDPDTLSPEDRKYYDITRSFESSLVPKGHYWTQSEVEAQCELLAAQLIAMEPTGVRSGNNA